MIGTSVGHYRVTARLSAGGMGVVYRAEHELLGKPAAIKLLHPELTTNRDLVDRFFKEAKLTTAVRHAGIVEVFDFGYLDSGHAYLVMELLDGEPLSAAIRRGRLTSATAVTLMRGVCSALAAAHAKGIVHRDLKPDNIFLVPDADSPLGVRPKLLDFGIAKLTDLGAAGSATRTGAVMGTPTYMSPEQCRGTGDVDQRADLYSLGCMLYELVAGRPPFISQGAGELIGQHLFVQPESPRPHAPELLPELERLIMALLAKNPAERPASALELAQRLDEVGRLLGAVTTGNALGGAMPGGMSGAMPGAMGSVMTPANMTPMSAPMSAPPSAPPGMSVPISMPLSASSSAPFAAGLTPPLPAPLAAPSVPPLGAMGSRPEVLGGGYGATPLPAFGAAASGPEAPTLATPHALRGWPQAAAAAMPGALSSVQPARRRSRAWIAIVAGGLVVGVILAVAVVMGGAPPADEPGAAGPTLEEAKAAGGSAAPPPASAAGEAPGPSPDAGAAASAPPLDAGAAPAVLPADAAPAVGSNDVRADVPADAGVAAPAAAGAAPTKKPGKPPAAGPGKDKPKSKPRSDVPALIEDDI